LEGELMGEAQERAQVQKRLAASEANAAALEGQVEAEARERKRLQAQNYALEGQVVEGQRAASAMEGQASAMAARLQEAQKQAADAFAALTASRSRSAFLEKAWVGAMGAAKVRWAHAAVHAGWAGCCAAQQACGAADNCLMFISLPPNLAR
jgi:hypothetical protein